MSDTTKCPKCGDCLKRDTVPRGHSLTVLWFCCGSRVQSNGSDFWQHPTCRERELTQQLTALTAERDGLSAELAELRAVSRE